MRFRLPISFVFSLAAGFLPVVGAGAEEGADLKKGIALRAEKKNQEALEVFKRVLAVSPGNALALVHMGATLEDLGASKGAEQAYRKALEVDPNNDSAKRNLHQLNVARDINSPLPGPKNTEETLMKKGFRALELKEFDTALGFFRLLRGFCPDDPRPLFYTALTWERRGEREKARSTYEQTVRTFPLFTPARVNLVVLLLEAGDRNAARKEARAALEAIPGDHRVRYLASLVGEEIRLSADDADVPEPSETK